MRVREVEGVVGLLLGINVWATNESSFIIGSVSDGPSERGCLFPAFDDFFLRVPTDIGGGGENNWLESGSNVAFAPGII